jgi:hypothetical protein
MDIGIERTVDLLDKRSMAETLGMVYPIQLTEWPISRTMSDQPWTECMDKETGMLSIWMLAMLTPSPGVTIMIPYKEGDENAGKIMNGGYFGKVPADRLIATEIIWFKADGKHQARSASCNKPRHSPAVMMPKTDPHIAWCDLPKGRTIM